MKLRIERLERVTPVAFNVNVSRFCIRLCLCANSMSLARSLAYIHTHTHTHGCNILVELSARNIEYKLLAAVTSLTFSSMREPEAFR